ncbi:hypothetical protein [Amycolatopsis sp. cg9]|uniref:Rv1733c family protein n=1 Tax=Amycolatopsis sp. cg9 TaxID=3238801 RepID=UPI0035244B48
MDTRTPLTRLRHSLRPGRTALARPSDRLQARLLALVIFLSLTAAAGAVLLGIGVYRVEAAKSAEQTAGRYVVQATLLADAPRPPVTGHGGTSAETGPTPATWRTRDGQDRAGEVLAAAGAVAGRQAEVWLDATGTPTERPLTAAAAVVGAPIAALTFWVAVTSGLVVLYRVVVFLLDRYRFAQWQREWFAVQARPAGS